MHPGADGRPWSTRPRLRWSVALAVVVIVFLFRFNTLGGSLGGFDDDHFINLARANQLLAGEWPLRDYPDASLQGVWPPLAYLMPAGAQLVAGRSLLAEGLLVTGIVAAGAGVAFLAASRLGMPLVLAAGAALLGVVPSIKLYGYARPLLFALTALLLHRYTGRPSTPRLLGLSALWSAAFLVRHDYAIYLGVGLVVALAARHWGDWRICARQVVVLGAVSLILLAPSLIAANQFVGLGTYLEDIQAAADDERRKTQLGWPAFDQTALASEANAIASAYYAALILPWLAIAVSLWRSRRPGAAAETATVLGLSAAAILANQYMLRGNLGARLADPAVLHAILATWLLWVAWQRPWERRLARGVVAAGAAVAMAAWLVALAEVGSLTREAATARFTEGPWATVKTTLRIARLLAAEPPREWTPPYPADGPMLAAAYLSVCTRPGHHVLNARYGAEPLVFGRRLFAGGQANMVPGQHASEREQRAMVDRASRQSIPIVLMEPLEESRAFDRDFPIVDAFMREHFVEVGTIPANDGVYARVLAHRNLLPAQPFGETGLPCFK